MGGVFGLAILLIAGFMLLAPPGTAVSPDLLHALQRATEGLDWTSAGLGFVAGALLGRLAGVRWGEMPGRFFASMSYHGRGFSLLGWIVVLGAFVMLY